MSIHPVSVHSGSTWSALCLASSRPVRASLRQSLGWRTDRVEVVMFLASFRGGLSLAGRCHWSQAPYCHPPPITIPRWSYSDSLYYDPPSQDGRTTSETRISSFALCCSRSHGGIIQINIHMWCWSLSRPSLERRDPETFLLHTAISAALEQPHHSDENALPDLR